MLQRYENNSILLLYAHSTSYDMSLGLQIKSKDLFIHLSNFTVNLHNVDQVYLHKSFSIRS